MYFLDATMYYLPENRLPKLAIMKLIAVRPNICTMYTIGNYIALKMLGF